MQYPRAGGRKAGHEHKAELRQHAGLIYATASRPTLTCDNKQAVVMLHG